eukprot:TRINITY_DN9475_c0_g1_i1.p1 TRINITY_DN9475_c0_g1~~TRINITY_DN9475_c0_g1_i1.p1  ORF type:complete len:163 (-),score=59.53 TRINITY_DN9475_c0_g1_i1:59-547(-)
MEETECQLCGSLDKKQKCLMPSQGSLPQIIFHPNCGSNSFDQSTRMISTNQAKKKFGTTVDLNGLRCCSGPMRFGEVTVFYVEKEVEDAQKTKMKNLGGEELKKKTASIARSVKKELNDIDKQIAELTSRREVLQEAYDTARAGKIPGNIDVIHPAAKKRKY